MKPTDSEREANHIAHVRRLLGLCDTEKAAAIDDLIRLELPKHQYFTDVANAVRRRYEWRAYKGEK